MSAAKWPEAHSQSKALYDRASQVMPGGITRILPWQEPFPVYAGSGSGAYVTDVDGTRRLDLLNNFASLIHGHAHPAIVAAIQEQVTKGTAFTLPTEPEVALAETICARAEGFEWIRFANSGSEAVMCAITVGIAGPVMGLVASGFGYAAIFLCAALMSAGGFLVVLCLYWRKGHIRN